MSIERVESHPVSEQNYFYNPASKEPLVLPVDERILRRAETFVKGVYEDAIQFTDRQPPSLRRVESALQRRLLPSLVEAIDIAEQIQTPKYLQMVDKVMGYLEGRMAGGACPDGRIIIEQFGIPRVFSLLRNLGGTVPAYKRDGVWVPEDPNLISSVEYFAERSRLRRPGQKPSISQFIGGHIDSMHPDHGCGAMTMMIRDMGHPRVTGTWFGGLEEYYQKAGEGFFALENVANSLGLKAATFDTTHDSYTQGLVFGLRKAHKFFDQNKTLRENLDEQARNNSILRTEDLVTHFGGRIDFIAGELGLSCPLYIEDYSKFGDNMIGLADVTLKLCTEEEAKGFPWIPDSVRQGIDPSNLRHFAFTALYNTTYLRLSRIQPGNHNRQKHPEKLIRLGPIGADNNVANISFIQVTQGGLFGDEDMDRLHSLLDLSEGVLEAQGVSLVEEARIIRITEASDAEDAIDPLNTPHLLRTLAIVQKNMARVRERYRQAVLKGEIVVAGFLHRSNDRMPVKVVGSSIQLAS